MQGRAKGATKIVVSLHFSANGFPCLIKMSRFIWVELFYIIFSIVLSIKDLPSLSEPPHRVLYTFFWPFGGDFLV